MAASLSFLSAQEQCENSKTFGAGDTSIVYDLLQGEDAAITIDDVITEVHLGPLYHDNGQQLERPGAFVCKPSDAKGCPARPYLRCPSSMGVMPKDEGPIMKKLRIAASRAAGVELNHAKVQLYKTRGNKIEDHADKVLDMCEDDAFVSFRLGATRSFTLRSKADSSVLQHIRATNNSAIVVGPRTNREWLHGVRPDRRPVAACSSDELDAEERSLSIIFRRAVTFWREDGYLFGGGARFKTEAELEAALAEAKAKNRSLDMGPPQEKLKGLIMAAWGRDNKSWTETRTQIYGRIIDVSVRWARHEDQNSISSSAARRAPSKVEVASTAVSQEHDAIVGKSMCTTRTRGNVFAIALVGSVLGMIALSRLSSSIAA